ncbi:MAG: type II secretion system secretin GspD [Deltaproteobacteria bacterium]|nr:type II secretion system secretin GspD [Deltaproteobacteria bacterium]
MNRPSIVPAAQATPLKIPKAPPQPSQLKPTTSRQTPNGPPPASTPVDKKNISKNVETVMLQFDKRDLAEVIQFVANFTGRNFILPERVSGKITIISNAPVPADEVWNVFVAALDANNWAVYPVGKYWKLSEKKQSARANIPTFLEPGQAIPDNEQMVTRLIKLKYVEADQMRNTLNQFTSRDSDFQIFPPDTLIISDLGLNMRRLQRLIELLDQPGGSEEIHVVQALYGSATELAQKLNEIFQAQQKTPGGQKQLGIAEPAAQIPGQPPPMPGAPVLATDANNKGPVTVSKILADDRTNKLIIIANSRSFLRVMELVKQLDVPSTGGGVHVYYLENAKAEEVATTLQALAQGVASGSKRRTSGAPGAPSPAGGAGNTADLFSGDVKITADKNTNSLVIIASTADYRNIVKVIEKLDIRRRQVFVEAVIMEVNLDHDSTLGTSMHGGTVLNNLTSQGSQGSGPLVLGSELGGLSSLGGVASLSSLGGFLAGLQGPAITLPGLNLTLPSFALLFNAMQKSSDVNVVSTPTVIMSDNSEGEITVGQNVPFQAGYSPSSSLSSLASQAGSSTAGSAIGSLVGLGGLGSLYAPIQRQNVELRLKIKPQINESDFVRLEIDEQTEEIASVDKTLGPTTSKRAAKTTVVARDQETVVIGGLIQERTIKSLDKVPVLGSIPVLGWLFRNEETHKTKTNLLLFLTPYIIRDQSDYRRIFERKMAERAEFVKRFTGEDAETDAVVDYSRKLGPLARMRKQIDSEMSRVENGGNGGADEKLIAPNKLTPEDEKNKIVPQERDIPKNEPLPAEPPPGTEPPSTETPGTETPGADAPPNAEAPAPKPEE